MEVGGEHISMMTQEVWTSVLGLSLDTGDFGVEHVPPDKRIIGCIQLTGEWKGALTLECTRDLAGSASSIMFDMPVEELDEELVRDAVGEITNMLGGNLKMFLPGPTSLSMPMVAEGGDVHLGFSRSQVLGRVPFSCDDQVLVVTVIKAVE